MNKPPMLKPGDKFICPNTPYFQQKGIANEEVVVITVTDFHYRVWSKLGTIFLTLDSVNNA